MLDLVDLNVNPVKSELSDANNFFSILHCCQRFLGKRNLLVVESSWMLLVKEP